MMHNYKNVYCDFYMNRSYAIWSENRAAYTYMYAREQVISRSSSMCEMQLQLQSLDGMARASLYRYEERGNSSRES